jgi:hypothetical protein
MKKYYLLIAATFISMARATTTEPVQPAQPEATVFVSQAVADELRTGLGDISAAEVLHIGPTATPERIDKNYYFYKVQTYPPEIHDEVLATIEQAYKILKGEGPVVKRSPRKISFGATHEIKEYEPESGLTTPIEKHPTKEEPIKRTRPQKYAPGEPHGFVKSSATIQDNTVYSIIEFINQVTSENISINIIPNNNHGTKITIPTLKNGLTTINNAVGSYTVIVMKNKTAKYQSTVVLDPITATRLKINEDGIDAKTFTVAPLITVKCSFRNSYPKAVTLVTGPNTQGIADVVLNPGESIIRHLPVGSYYLNAFSGTTHTTLKKFDLFKQYTLLEVSIQPKTTRKGLIEDIVLFISVTDTTPRSERKIFITKEAARLLGVEGVMVAPHVVLKVPENADNMTVDQAYTALIHAEEKKQNPSDDVREALEKAYRTLVGTY